MAITTAPTYLKDWGFSGGSVGKEPACQCRRWRVPSLGQEDPLEKEMATHYQYSCLGNPMDRGAWQATVQRVERVGRDLLNNNNHLKDLL